MPPQVGAKSSQLLGGFQTNQSSKTVSSSSQTPSGVKGILFCWVHYFNGFIVGFMIGRKFMTVHARIKYPGSENPPAFYDFIYLTKYQINLCNVK